MEENQINPEEVEVIKSPEQIAKEDLLGKAEILNQVKASLAAAKEEVITGISFKYADRTVTLNIYQDDEERNTNYGNVASAFITKLISKINAEIKSHENKAKAIVVPE